jgi:hypothetical protein
MDNGCKKTEPWMAVPISMKSRELGMERGIELVDKEFEASRQQHLDSAASHLVASASATPPSATWQYVLLLVLPATWVVPGP